MRLLDVRMLFIQSRGFMSWMRSTCWWLVIRKLLKLWLGLFGTCWIMLNKEGSILWGCGFMDARLVRQKDTLVLDIMLKEEDQNKKEISVELKLSSMKKKRINFWMKSLKETVLLVLPMLLEECFWKNQKQIITPSLITHTSQQQRAVNKQASYWREESTS